MICTQCGSENPDTDKFCNQCGAALQTQNVQKTGWSSFSPPQQVPLYQIRQPEVWKGGTSFDALKVFVREPKNTAPLMEDPNAPNGLIFFYISMIIVSFTQGYISSRITTYSYLDGEPVAQTTGNILTTMISTMITSWLIGTLILAGLIIVGRPKTSPIRERNAFFIAASINGFRSVVDLVYYLLVLIWLPFEKNTVIEVYQSTESITSLLSPEIITLQMPSVAYQLSVQVVSIITFAYSYYLLYQVLVHGLKLEGVLYKFVIIAYAGLSLIGKIFTLISIFSLL